MMTTQLIAEKLHDEAQVRDHLYNKVLLYIARGEAEEARLVAGALAKVAREMGRLIRLLHKIGPRTITFTKRDDGVHVSISGTGAWASGRTHREALGDLVYHNLELFGLSKEVKYEGFHHGKGNS
jgi:hypothetical protein